MPPEPLVAVWAAAVRTTGEAAGLVHRAANTIWCMLTFGFL